MQVTSTLRAGFNSNYYKNGQRIRPANQDFYSRYLLVELIHNGDRTCRPRSNFTSNYSLSCVAHWCLSIQQ